MKNAFVVFLLVFSLAFFCIASVLVPRARINMAITRSPGLVSATATDVFGLRNNGYKVRYVYRVGGTTYHVESDALGRTGSDLPTVDQLPNVEVAYYTNDPSVAVLKHYYENRSPNQSVTREAIVSALWAFAVAFICSLAAGWEHGWFDGIRVLFKRKSPRRK